MNFKVVNEYGQEIARIKLFVGSSGSPTQLVYVVETEQGQQLYSRPIDTNRVELAEGLRVALRAFNKPNLKLEFYS